MRQRSGATGGSRCRLSSVCRISASLCSPYPDGDSPPMQHSPLTGSLIRQGLPLHKIKSETHQLEPRFLDCYDRAVGILTRHPHLIPAAWSLVIPGPSTERRSRLVKYCHCLFGYITPDRQLCHCGDGCLTQIRHLGTWANAGNSEFTKAIQSDTRIPHGGQVTIDDLPIFAGYQRRADKILNRDPLPICP